jgi:hypothetical protein
VARKIEVEITGDSRSLEKALDRTSKKSKSSFDKIGKAARAGALAIGGVLAGAAVVGFKELMETQKVAAQTAAVLESTGGAAHVTAKGVETLASSLSELSGVDDEAIASSENLLLTFTKITNEAGKAGGVFDRATATILDMSVAMGTDLNSATIQVGKALNDPIKGITALTRVGVSFTASQKALIKRLVETGRTSQAQKLILHELNKEFGGSAKAAGDTLPGQLNKLKNAFEETTAALLSSLLPAVERVLGKVTEFSKWAQKNPQQMRVVVIGLAALAAALAAASVAQAALNLAVLANPYVAAVVGVVALGAAIAVLVKKVDFFRDHWQLLLLPISAFGVLVATVVKASIRNFDKLQDSFNTVKRVAVVAFDVVRAKIMSLAAPVLTIIGHIRDLIGWISRIPNLPFTGGAGSDLFGGTSDRGGARGAPRLASGGDISRTGLAMVHRGERVVPAGVVNRGGGGGEFALVWAGPDFMRWMREEERRQRRGGASR